jgi:outer membrane protein
VLTLGEVRATALKMYPGISVAQLRELISRQTLVETRAGYFPVISANATAVGTGEAITRLAAGSLSNSQIYDHVGVGATASQLITDFGRTANLVEAAKSQLRAANADVAATRAQILLAVDTAFFEALQAQAVKTVANKTLANRQLLFDRVSALTKSQLKSELDVRFARVAVSEAQLIISKADDDLQTARARLASLMGQRTLFKAELKDESSGEGELPGDAEVLTDLALRQRPELLRQRAQEDAAQNIARAARDARRPNITALASAGVVPIRDAHFDHNYAAAGLNLNLPLFAGGLYRAREREAQLQADSADAMRRDLENAVARDVRIAWLQASHARERVALTESLLENSRGASELAHARFDQGMSSIIELSQAELAEVSSEIEHTSANYDYRMRRDILDYQTGSLH